MATNNGIPGTQINTLERVTSPDLNSLATKTTGALMEIWRQMYGLPRRNGDLVNGVPYAVMEESQDSQFSETGILRSVIPGGLLINPQNTHLFVDSGVMFCATEPVDGEGVFNYCSSPGVEDPAALPFVANAGAGPRWDMVVCRPVETTTNVTVPIYDPNSESFSGVESPKYTVNELEFDYVQGTGASPAPAPVVPAGWQPLCLVWVPNSALSFDDCELFDVRPTVAGLTDGVGSSVGGSDVSGSQAGAGSSVWRLQPDATGGDLRLNGQVYMPYGAPGQRYVSAIGAPQGNMQYTLSGRISNTAVGGTTTGGAVPPNLFDAAVNGVTPIIAKQWFSFGVIFPFGLARCHKYTNDTVEGRRWPIEMGGIVTLISGGFGAGARAFSTLPAEYDTLGSQHLFVSLGSVQGTNGGTYLRPAYRDNGGWTTFLDADNAFYGELGSTGTDSYTEWTRAQFLTSSSILPQTWDFRGEVTALSGPAWTTGISRTLTIGTYTGSIGLPLNVTQKRPFLSFEGDVNTSAPVEVPASGGRASGDGDRVLLYITDIDATGIQPEGFRLTIQSYRESTA